MPTKIKAKGSLQDLDRASFTDDFSSDVARRTLASLSVGELVAVATNSGLLAGVTYDQIFAAVNGVGDTILDFELVSICQMQVVISITDNGTWSITKRDCIGDLLQENGDQLLQENGDGLLVEGAF